MNSQTNGISTLDHKITSINDLGLWILIGDKEYFIPFDHYPGFKESSVREIFSVQFLPPGQLRWESLDIDIELAALSNPESFPLIYRA